MKDYVEQGRDHAEVTYFALPYSSRRGYKRTGESGLIAKSVLNIQ